MLDNAGAAVFVTGATTPPEVDNVGPAASVAGASAPPMVVLAGAAAVAAAGATAPRAVDNTGAAVVVAGLSVTGDVVGVVCAAGGPLRFGSTGAVLVTAACARLADDVLGTVVGVCVAVETSGLAVLVSVTG